MQLDSAWGPGPLVIPPPKVTRLEPLHVQLYNYLELNVFANLLQYTKTPFLLCMNRLFMWRFLIFSDTYNQIFNSNHKTHLVT